MTTDKFKEHLTALALRSWAPPTSVQTEPEAIAVSTPEIGEMVEGQGIFLGQWQPKDRDGISFSKTFNVFAAPQDLPGTMTYIDTVKRVAELKDWNGFDGTNYATDKEIYTALKDGSYAGGWIIPPLGLLMGTEPDGEVGVRKGRVIPSDNLFDHQNKRAFKDTFKTVAASGSDWHWSSTENPGNLSIVWGIRFSDGGASWSRKDKVLLSCWPVRLVECPVKAP